MWLPRMEETGLLPVPYWIGLAWPELIAKVSRSSTETERKRAITRASGDRSMSHVRGISYINKLIESDSLFIEPFPFMIVPVVKFLKLIMDSGEKKVFDLYANNVKKKFCRLR